ncbi:MAG: hypothetical protein AAFX87_31655 [Bacteroidota bacterium]
MESFKKFKTKVELVRKHSLKEISVAFLFGLVLRSAYHIKDHLELTREHVQMSHSLFSEKDKEQILPIILKTQNGEDDQGNSELDYIEPGKLEFEYIMKRALEFNRPDFSIFFILGLMKGSLNEKVVTESDYKELFTMLPNEFVRGYKKELIEVNNYFDEIGFKMNIENGKIVTV